MTQHSRISINPEKRFGQPCIRDLRITVADVLHWLANGQTIAEIIEDFPELDTADIYASLSFAANRERHTRVLSA